MKKYSIGEIAKKYQLSTDTLRYYDKAGLLPFVKKDAAGRRVFTDNDLGYLEVIGCLKKSRVPIKDIAQFMTWCTKGDRTLTQRYEFMIDHQQQLETEIKELADSLAFIKWKTWYYKEANLAGKESIFFKEGTKQVDEKWYNIYKKMQISEPSSEKYV